ncbi:MAG TPA: DNA polymerase/3'-5' exonuclease PolX [Puia sp.]|uniref:DNA polymerase/3'-5' exonuclease PolX n=1 Tax=Puia sp. TaxID=2045100 RepID=UPI002BCDE9D5|nr:DNA polymerase/3'-5' exonuclease PolX [Puia sp.]HVU94124.1 DNA polymerase/3'-5' exonuclease PolX [Puia sp.]
MATITKARDLRPGINLDPSAGHNAELANIFHQMASCYRYLGARHRFRVIAYDNAVQTINGLKDDISTYAAGVKTLDKLHGVGVSIASKIIEFLQTGQIAAFEKLKQRVPPGLLPLMDINGFGPATVKTLHKKLGVSNQEEMLAAIESGRIGRLKGFGPKKINNMRKGLQLFAGRQTRMLLWDAMQIGDSMLNAVLAIPGVKKADLAGSLRRRKETIGDIDIVATADKKDWTTITGRFTNLPVVQRVLAAGKTKASILLQKSNAQIDLRLVSEQEYGSALLYFTGSREHNIALRTWAKTRGWKLNEYGVFETDTNKRLAGATEEEIYRLFGMHFIPPELREEKGGIDLARKGPLPKLIEIKDIRGDMHVHSTWSDGTADIGDIAGHLRKTFPAYEYVVITDHSPSQRVARGLTPQEFTRQFAEIDRLNAKLGLPFVRKGVEVDILADGSLDLSDHLLKQFDWVVASIHSLFNQDNTERLITACEHPLVCCIGHPGGRLIGKREPYPVDWRRLIQKAATTGTALEINAQPERLDIPDTIAKEAAEKGVRLAIGTDAHALNQFDFMSMGVSMARRGWCTKENILNTAPWKEIERFRSAKRHGE